MKCSASSTGPDPIKKKPTTKEITSYVSFVIYYSYTNKHPDSRPLEEKPSWILGMQTIKQNEEKSEPTIKGSKR